MFCAGTYFTSVTTKTMDLNTPKKPYHSSSKLIPMVWFSLNLLVILSLFLINTFLSKTNFLLQHSLTQRNVLLPLNHSSLSLLYHPTSFSLLLVHSLDYNLTHPSFLNLLLVLLSLKSETYFFPSFIQASKSVSLCPWSNWHL